jgi:hypothetical protein
MTYSSLQGGLFFVAAVLALGVTLLALFARRSAK